MSRTFEDARQISEDAIAGMDRQLLLLTRTYNRYMKHGAVNAAADLKAEMEALDHDIQFEREAHKLAFY